MSASHAIGHVVGGSAGVRDDLWRIATNCMLDDWTFSNPRPIHGAQEIVPILESVY